MLELAVLGLLDEHPMHGYELRKRLSELLGTVRTVSFGSLYPTLRKLQQAGHIVEDASAATQTRPPASRRGRKTYRITDEGRAELVTQLTEPGAAGFTDDGFGVHLAFFDRTPPAARLRVLEGRRRVLEERREGQRDVAGRHPGDCPHSYTRQLTLLGLETSERELRWINELIGSEQAAPAADHTTTTDTTTDTPVRDTKEN